MNDEFSALKAKVIPILLPFPTSYLREIGFSRVHTLNTKYRSQLCIDKELKTVNFLR